MRYPATLTIAILMALAPAAATGQAGLYLDRAAGLGLKPSPSATQYPATGVFSDAAVQAWQGLRASEYALYSGGSDASPLGLRASESYVGVIYSSGAWASSFEVAHMDATPLTPRRYTLTGQVHTPLGEGRALSVGLKYRAPDPDMRYGGMPAETLPVNGYTLAVPRYGQGYQVQMSYQHSAASAFGVALGRDVETFTPLTDPTGSGPRQLSFTGQHWLTPSWALSYDILSHDVAAPLKLQGLRLGVRYRW
jgi:hypothetical protein